MEMNLPSETKEPQEITLLEKLKQDCRSELDQAQKELHEIIMLIEQSQMESSKLQQRNASISTHLQQIQSQIDSVSKPDIRMAYDAALDAQQRLFVMRGQLDKLQSDQTRLEHYIGILERVDHALTSEEFSAQGSSQDQSALAKTVEMIIQAQEAERRRLARQMHDGPAQALSNFILQTEIAMRLFDVDQAKAKEELAGVKTAASSTFQKVRDFIFDLRPMMLDDLGLVPTMNRYVETFKEQSGVDLRFVSTGMEQRLESYIEVMVFRAIQELLSNVSRHSQATQAIIQMDSSANGIRVSLEDNGKGFDPEKVSDKAGMGLKVIRDRVQMLGGTMDVHSTISQGTHILFQVPTTNASPFS
jgi:two-component system, NarL family, sensor histidine kinase DegS